MGIGEGVSSGGNTTSWVTTGSDTSGINFSMEFEFGKRTPTVTRVEFHNDIATVVYWSDDTVTRVKVGKGEVFNPEVGLAMAIAKKMCGSYEKFARSLNMGKHYVDGVKVSKVKANKSKSVKGEKVKK